MSLGVEPQELLLLDQHPFPREKLCGGIVTAYGMELLEGLNLSIGGDFLPYYELRTPKGTALLRERRGSLVVSRKVLDDALLRLAMRLGVPVETGVKVVGVEVRRNGVLLSTHAGTKLPSRYGVFADGALGYSRTLFPSPPLLSLLEGECTHPEPEPFQGKITFDLRLASEGFPAYTWVIPVAGGSRFRVGIMGGKAELKGGVLRERLKRFVQRQGFRWLEPPRGWAIRPYSCRSTFGKAPLYRTGEALGVDPLLGEGIAVSLGMGRFLASLLYRKLKGGFPTPSTPFLFTELGWNLFFRATLARWFYEGDSRFWLEKLHTPPLRELAESGTLTYNTLARGYRQFLLALLSPPGESKGNPRGEGQRNEP